MSYQSARKMTFSVNFISWGALCPHIQKTHQTKQNQSHYQDTARTYDTDTEGRGLSAEVPEENICPLGLPSNCFPPVSFTSSGGSEKPQEHKDLHYCSSLEIAIVLFISNQK